MLEVVVTNTDDALNAERGGAGRLEIVSNPDQDGLTPDLEVVKKIRDHVKIPLHIMIRDRNTFEEFSSKEIEKMAKKIEEMEKLEIQGVVLGFIKKNRIDFDALKKVLVKKGNLSVTFHKAFDKLQSHSNSINELITFGLVDRILTSGGNGTALDGVNKLKQINMNAKDKIKIIAAGSISESNIRFIKDSTGINEFHVGRSVRKNSKYNSAIDPDKVNQIVKILNQNNEYL